jgi:UDP-glucose 4-epimerase
MTRTGPPGRKSMEDDVTSGSATVLVTGGAGFIGSHTCVELLEHGYDVVVVDNLSRSSRIAIDRVEELAGREIAFHDVDVRDRRALSGVFATHRIDAVVHFAAFKAVGESVDSPLEYYDNNLRSTMTLVDVMRQFGVDDLVFSSSCSIYGDAIGDIIDEEVRSAPASPYARTKAMCERILEDICTSDDRLTVVALRYFNPAGAHPSGRLGEDPAGIPTNIVPYLMQVAIGRLPHVPIFGGDYATRDGTGVRDFLHVMDLAEGHRLALERLDRLSGYRVINLGTETGTSVLELVAAFSDVVGQALPYEIVDRRPGDVPALVASAKHAWDELGWAARRDLRDICRDAWAFQRSNPSGYRPPDVAD